MNLPFDIKVSAVTPLLYGPTTPSSLIDATRKVYAVPHVRSKNVADIRDVSPETVPKRDVNSYEYRRAPLSRLSHAKSSQDILKEFAVTSDAVTSVGTVT